MRSPVWMISSGLLVLFLLLLASFTLFRKKVPARVSLKPKIISLPPRKALTEEDVKEIYENDLFGTYKTPLPPVVEPDVDTDLPTPPTPKYPPPFKVKKATFLDPLKISLKGIIYASDEQDNRAVISDDKTKKEQLYHVGETIEDGEIIRINKNKIILIRSNGQQEVVFLSEADAARDKLFEQETTWNDVIRRVSSSSFLIDPLLLQQRINNVAEFISMLDMTSALQQEVAYGIQIGRLASDSVGRALGLQSGDVILSINDMPVATTENHMAAYKLLTELPLGVPLTIKAKRGFRTITLTYMLQDLSEEQDVQQKAPLEAIKTADLMPEALRQKEKTHMKETGGQSAFIKRPLKKQGRA